MAELDRNKLLNLEHLEAAIEGVKENFVKTAELPEYTLARQEAAENGYLSTYVLKKGEVQVGEKINVPKDYLVKSAAVKTADTADAPYAGAKAGDKYIDFVVNAKEGAGTESHIYLPVNELVDVYTAGNGVSISAGNQVSVKVDGSNANGLSAGAGGLSLAAATAATAGAMTAAQASKLEGVAAGAQVNKIEAVKVNGTTLSIADKAVNVTVPAKVSQLTNDSNYLASGDVSTITAEEIKALFQ